MLVPWQASSLVQLALKRVRRQPGALADYGQTPPHKQPSTLGSAPGHCAPGAEAGLRAVLRARRHGQAWESLLKSGHWRPTMEHPGTKPSAFCPLMATDRPPSPGFSPGTGVAHERARHQSLPALQAHSHGLPNRPGHAGAGDGLHPAINWFSRLNGRVDAFLIRGYGFIYSG